MPKPLALEPSHRAPHLLHLLSNDVITKITVGAGLVALPTQLLREIEYDRHWEAVVLAGQGNERIARLRLHICSIDNCEFAGGQSFSGDEVEHLEGVVRCRLAIFVIAYKPSAIVGRQHFGGFEVLPGKCGLP